MIKNLAMIASAAMMTALPVAASAAPITASPTVSNPALTLAGSPNFRASTKSRHKEGLFGGSIIVVVLAVVAIGAGAAAGAGAFNGSSSN